MNYPTIEFLELSHQILSKGNYLRFRAQGMSMFPFIRNGEIIQIKPAEISAINYADIIFYCIEGDKLAVHRVIKKSKQNGKTVFLTKGDSTLSFATDLVYSEDILGKVVAIEKEDRILRIDKGFLKTINILYTKLLPFSKYLCLVLQRLQNLKSSLKQKCKRYHREDKLIFLSFCLSLDNNEGKKDQIVRLLRCNLDWDYILKKSKKEGLAPLMYYHLDKFNHFFPKHILEFLQKNYYANFVRNTLIIEKTKEILKAFAKEKIKAIVLKGGFLAENIYKNIALRPFEDFDILINKEDFFKVDKVLNSLNYSKPFNYRDFLECTAMTSLHTLMYRPQDSTQFFVHLHWHLINSTWPLDSLAAKIDMQRVWSFAHPTKIGGADALTLSPEHLLLYLAQHSQLHAFDRLILISDILETLRCYKDRINWEFVLEEAERFNLSFLLHRVLTLTSRLLDFDIPQLKKLSHIKRTFSQRILSSFIQKGARSYILSYLTYLFMHKGLLPKLRFIAKTIFPSRYVLAHTLKLAPSQIRPYHYYQRIRRRAFKFFRQQL